MKELDKNDIMELHKKAEILASQIEHKDLNYENKYKFENMKKETSENIEKLQKASALSGQEIDRLSEIIQNERTLELQKQHELQIQQSQQKSRGYEIEI